MYSINRAGFSLSSNFLKCFSKYLKVGCQCNSSSAGYIPFETMVENRRKQARHSVIVEVPHSCDLDRLQVFCMSYGQLEDVFTYTPPAKQRMVLLEFSEEASVQNLLHEYCHLDQSGVTIQMPFLKLSKVELLRNISPTHKSILKPKVHLGSENEVLKKMIRQCKNVSEQIQYYYDHMKMTEIGWRIRFMTCRKIEWLLPKLLSHHKVLPFGSSVNTFGKQDCDLDMVIDFDTETSNKMHHSTVCIQSLKSLPPINDRGNVQRNLQLVADIMMRFMPGFTEVHKILHANVPIIKFRETFTGLECDLSVGSRSGFSMSQYLYSIGCCDPRVRPLVFSVRYWASSIKLTDKTRPGKCVSNFTLSLMVIFYLMNTKIPVIPRMKDVLLSKAELSKSPNNSSLGDLLCGFFKFYAEFDYRKKGISIISGTSFPKKDFCPFYIENPIESGLNVTKNLNLEAVEQLKSECLEAVSKFSKIENKSDAVWGLPCLGSFDENKMKSILEDDNSEFLVQKFLQSSSNELNSSKVEASNKSKNKNSVPHNKSEERGRENGKRQKRKANIR